MNDVIDTFRYLVSGYYGVESMDDYDLKVFILKDIENYIKNFINDNKIEGFNYQSEALKISDTLDLKTKLQDSLLILYKINAPMELIFMIKAKIKEIDNKD